MAMTVRMTVSMHREVAEALEELAEDVGPWTTRSDAARRAIEEGLKAMGKLPEGYRSPRKYGKSGA